jgi:hypothetical protein
MTTKIEVKVHNFNSLRLNKDTLDRDLKDYYCKESPEEVLKTLVGKYHISHYQSIGINFFNTQNFKRQDGNISLVQGLKISELEKDLGLTTNNSIFNYAPVFVMGDFTKQHFDIILNHLAKKYLIKTNIISYGSYIPGSIPHEIHVRPSRTITMGERELSSYIDLRKKEIDSKKEQNLTDILVYGKAVIGDSFNEKNIIQVINRIIKNTPKKFDPQFGPTNPIDLL